MTTSSPQKTLYVQISRLENADTIITDDTDKLMQTIQRETGENKDALEEIVRAQLADRFKNADRLTTLLDARKGPEIDPREAASGAAKEHAEHHQKTDERTPGPERENASESQPQKEPETAPENRGNQALDDRQKHFFPEPSKSASERDEPWDKDAALQKLEEGWAKLIEDRERSRGNRSR